MGSIEIIEAMRGYDKVIIIDAIMTGSTPGTIYRVNLTRGESPPILTHSHGTDLLTILQLGCQLYENEMPIEVLLLAIEAEDTTTIGDKLTPSVSAATVEVVNLVVKYFNTSS